ncbi:MAG: FprA family A-type flavoprotein [Deltaproteobacteria bacterium]
MESKKVCDGVFWVGALDWDRRLFDSLIPLPDGTSYNAYLVKGSDKTALIDTVDPSKTSELMARLAGVERIDYIISQHSEQDHSGAIPAVLARFKDAKVVTNSKGKEMLAAHLGIDPAAIMVVNDGETLSLGDKTIEFISTPWVHWPETMSCYIREDQVLFTCDLFGAHLASSSVFVEDDHETCLAAKRYYAEVMMPFRSAIKKHLERFSRYEISVVAPSHGPVHPIEHVGCVMDFHRQWVSDKVSNTVVIPYASMHGSTEMMVSHLAEMLSNGGVRVERYNLAVTDTGRLLMAMVDAATVVFGTPTVLTGAHPMVASAAFVINALKPKAIFASVIGSYGWGGKSVEQITSMISGLKAEMLEPVVIKGRPTQADFGRVEVLAGLIISKHREAGLF